jgi:predicted short-subunit dehydrogenase-like oxidoreductase (DUF2520 family)
MIKVIIIGSGNVAQHFIQAMTAVGKAPEGIDLIQVFARKKESLTGLFPHEKTTSNYSELLEADLYLIAVSDDAIAEVSAALPFKNRLVAHVSGGADMNVLNNNNRRAVFYPLQTFTKNKAVDFKTIPLCLEAENTVDFSLLNTVAKLLSDQPTSINSQQRKALHVAAVFVNNFTNHLYAIGNSICEANQVPFSVLKPLIQETAQKITEITPLEAQTGPAKRNDSETIKSHQAFLTDANQRTIYQLLTQSIQNHGKEL